MWEGCKRPVDIHAEEKVKVDHDDNHKQMENYEDNKNDDKRNRSIYDNGDYENTR